MTVSTNWIYLDDQNRVSGCVSQSKPIDRSWEGAIPCEFPLSKDIQNALYDAENQCLIFDAVYDQYQAEKHGSENEN